MKIKKEYLKNGILVYKGDNYGFYITAGFGCVCDHCNRKMATTYYYPILGRAVCPLCHEEIKARQEGQTLALEDEHYQKKHEQAFDRRIKMASLYMG